MEFSSIFNIWLFLPTLVIVYFIFFVLTDKDANHKYTNIVLFIFSILFYLIGSSISNLLMVVLFCFATYSFAMLIENSNKKEKIFALSIVMNIGILCVFKYANMFIKLISIFSTFGKVSIRDFIYELFLFKGKEELQTINIIFPLALSFIIFQNISYLVDVYRNEIKAEKNFYFYLMYNILFLNLHKAQ